MTRPTSALVARLGTANAVRLAQLVGGTRLHIPPTMRLADRLRNRVGDELAILLVMHFGGCRVYVATGTRAHSVDARQVKRMAAKGWSSARIARKLGCSERVVDTRKAELRVSLAAKSPGKVGQDARTARFRGSGIDRKGNGSERLSAPAFSGPSCSMLASETNKDERVSYKNTA